MLVNMPYIWANYNDQNRRVVTLNGDLGREGPPQIPLIQV